MTAPDIAEVALVEDDARRPYPIKLRAWEKASGTMLDWNCLMQTAFNLETKTPLLYEVVADPTYRFVKMLFTGLKDKNDRPIYEGDIVEAVNQGYRARFVVQWRQAGAPLWLLYPAWQNREFWHLHGSKNRDGDWTDKGIEVLGNIFQNPDIHPEAARELGPR